MKYWTIAMIIGVFGATALPVFAAAPEAPTEVPDDAGPELMATLDGVQTGAHLTVTRVDGRLVIADTARDRVLLIATRRGVTQTGPSDLKAPARGEKAVTEVVRDAKGTVVYTVSRTARGAWSTILAPGAVNTAGLEVTAFDNDDVEVSDTKGRLVFSRQTAVDGVLTERSGPELGCGCERVTDVKGRTLVRRF